MTQLLLSICQNISFGKIFPVWSLHRTSTCSRAHLAEGWKRNSKIRTKASRPTGFWLLTARRFIQPIDSDLVVSPNDLTSLFVSIKFGLAAARHAVGQVRSRSVWKLIWEAIKVSGFQKHSLNQCHTDFYAWNWRKPPDTPTYCTSTAWYAAAFQ